jgi:uncharacterized membrane protein
VSSAQALLAVTAFLACGVEMVEALTIVLAAGVARGWRSSLIGAAAGLGVLAVVVAVLGPAITRLPIDALRVAVGTLLLIFGLQWLRKAVLRASGLKALHDEDAIYAAELEAARAAPTGGRAGVDAYAFTLSFKGVLLEGLEVAFIVLGFSNEPGGVRIGAIAAALALGVVIVTGVALHAPLSRVPENTMKLGVGLMLTTFGTFWAAEGAGAEWPGGDAALPALLLLYAALSLLLVRAARRPAPVTPAEAAG